MKWYEYYKINNGLLWSMDLNKIIIICIYYLKSVYLILKLETNLIEQVRYLERFKKLNFIQ